MTGKDPLWKARRLFDNRTFSAHPLLWNGHLQTIVGARQKRSFRWGWSSCQTRILSLADETTLRVRFVRRDPDAPTVVLVHGMSGSSESGYMLGLSHKAFREGWNSLLLDLYNLNPDRSAPKVFHAGCSQDLSEIIGISVPEFGLKTLFLVGISMGGNIVLKFLGENGSDVGQIRGAAVISPLIDLTQSWPVFDRRSNLLYQVYYLKRLRQLTLASPHQIGRWVDLDRLEKVRSIKRFDELVTAPLGGFADVFEYYEKASCLKVLPGISVPTLLIHSLDDPLLPPEPLCGLERNGPNLMIHLTQRGGHVAFIERHLTDIDRSWAENRAIDFLRVISAE